MSNEPKLFKVNPDKKKAIDMEEVNFAELGLKERRDIQEWIAANPKILGQKLLIIAKEFSGFEQTRERLDLLAVDTDGQLVIIELKRDDSGDDTHWQAIKYASYIHGIGTSNFVDMLAQYQDIEEDEARQLLVEHTDSDDDLDRLNENQRIILASHRFAPSVTSAALWLNEQAGRDIVTCVQLTPYKDSESGELYLLANVIIPVPGAESYFVGLRKRSSESTGAQRGPNPNKADLVTVFCEKVSSGAFGSLSDELRPTKTSRWAGGNPDFRYYHMWYAGEDPWGNWKLSYRIDLKSERNDQEELVWNASIGLGYNRSIVEELKSQLQEISGIDNLEKEENYLWVTINQIKFDDSSCNSLAQILSHFIQVVTPKVREFVNEKSKNNSEESTTR